MFTTPFTSIDHPTKGVVYYKVVQNTQIRLGLAEKKIVSPSPNRVARDHKNGLNTVTMYIRIMVGIDVVQSSL